MAAPKEPLTTLRPRLIETVAEMTSRGELFKPREIIQGLMLCPGVTTEMRVEVLCDQAALARRKKNHAWLDTVAREADSLQFQSRSWIAEHLSPLPKANRAPSAMPAGPPRDFRMDIDPAIERRLGDAVTATLDLDYEDVDPEEEERLLREDSPPIKEHDFSTLSGPDISGCPVARRQIIKRPPVPCSDTAAGQSEPTRISPVRFPSLEPCRSSPRRVSQRRNDNRKGQPEPPRRRSSSRSRQPEPPRRRSSSRSRRSPRRRARSRSPRKSQHKRRKSSRSANRKRLRQSPARKPRDHRPHSPRRRVEQSPQASGSHSSRGDAKKAVASKSSAQPPKRKMERVDRCPMAECRDFISRAHAATHLPAIFNDELEPTEELSRQRRSALQICESLVLETVSNLDGLVRFVNDTQQIREGHYHVSVQQARAMSALSAILGEETPNQYTIVPVNSPAVLIHWRVLSVIVACLSDKERQDLMERYPVTNTWVAENLPQGFDSHFHLDRSRSNLDAPGASVEELCDLVQPDQEFRINLTGGVIVFCDPPTYPTRAEMQHLKSEGYVIALGLHPKYTRSYTEADYTAFEETVSLPEVTALGEVGLDYSADPSTWNQQHVALDRVLKQLQPSHVLVLHARGAYYQLLFQLKGVVPREQRIHLHCFEGDQQLMLKWLEEFPRTHFGFTGLVQHFSQAKQEALRTVAEDQLLVETDSPYFKIGERKHSSPALVGMVAKMVADVRGATWQEILEVCSRNARRLYEA